jgi:hypothetical protein
MFHFEFVANAPPGSGAIELVGVATTTESELPYSLDVLTPQAASNDDNGFIERGSGEHDSSGHAFHRGVRF